MLFTGAAPPIRAALCNPLSLGRRRLDWLLSDFVISLIYFGWRDTPAVCVCVCVCGADAGPNMEAQRDPPRQGQPGASVGGRDNVRQACSVEC